MKVKDHTLVFTGAGQRQLQMDDARFLRVREADGEVFIQVDSASEISREKGEQVPLGSNNRLVMIRSEIAQTVKLTSSALPQDDNRSAVSVSTTTTVDPSNNIAGVAKKTCTAAGSVQLVAGNANRVRLIVKVPSDQPDGVWLSGAASSANNGDFIEAGERLILGTTAELWAYGNGSSDVDLAVTEEEII